MGWLAWGARWQTTRDMSQVEDQNQSIPIIVFLLPHVRHGMHTPTQTSHTHICECVCSLRFQRLRV